MQTTDTLILSREGIFPLANGATGTGLSGTLQGEGKLVGIPSMFVRLQGCNLRCVWTASDGTACSCDTAHTSFGPGQPQIMSVGNVFETLRQNMGQMTHVVITGGEPLMQTASTLSLIELCRNEGWHTTIETNGTIFSPQVVRSVSLLSISPKLSSSIPTIEKLAQLGLKNSSTIQNHKALIANKQPLYDMVSEAQKYQTEVQLKFVVSCEDDEKEIKEQYADVLKLLLPTDVVIMPMGYSTTEIAQNAQIALKMCLRNNWRYTPRLHIDLFGNKEGV